MFCQDFKYSFGIFTKFSNCVTEYEDIIHVYNHDVFSNKLVEYVVHHVLECRRGVAKSKEHNCWFEQSTVGLEGSFVLVSFTNTDIIESPSDVEFREIFGPLEFSQEVFNQG